MNFDKKFLKKDLLIISDVDSSYSKVEKRNEQVYLNKLFKQIKKYGVNVFYEEVLNEEEMKNVLQKHDKKNTVVFNWCERFDETDGNEGRVSSIYEKLGYTFTGCGTKALKLLSNKYKCTRTLQRAGVKVPKSYSVKIDDSSNKKNFKSFNIDFSKEYFVKSNLVHASLGITKDNLVTSKAEFKKVASRYKNYEADLIVQKFIEGEEYTALVWGNKEPEVLPILKVDFHNSSGRNICTYAEKFDADSEEYVNGTFSFLSSKKEPKLYKKIVALITKAYKALGIHDYARFDIKYDGKDVYVIDSNANSYMNRITDNEDECEVYKSTGAIGYNWGETILRICEFAYKRSLK